MDLVSITQFFKCCSIINISILAISSIMIMTSDLGYNIHSRLGLWQGSKEAHKQLMYSLLGNYKILIIVFNLVPYFSLCCCISN